MLLEDVLGDLGCAVVGPFGQMDEALSVLTTHPGSVDFGILDVNIAGERSDPVALEFDRLGLPFVFSTGYAESALEARWRSKPCLHNPFRPADVERILLEEHLRERDRPKHLRSRHSRSFHRGFLAPRQDEQEDLVHHRGGEKAGQSVDVLGRRNGIDVGRNYVEAG